MNLSVKAAGTAMVPDYAALDSGILRFVGRAHSPSAGPNGGWTPTGEAVTIPMRAEYVQEVKGGGLEPADAETARLCGVPFAAPKVHKTAKTAE